MTDAEFEAQMRRVDALIDKWRPLLGLSYLRCVLRWHRGLFESGPPFGQVEPCTARTTPHWPYAHFSIDWNLAEVMETDDAYLEHVVVHELSHVLIAPIAPEDEPNLKEQVVETITAALLGAYRGKDAPLP